jgi:hypothetical protein
MTSSLTESNNSSSFVILSHPTTPSVGVSSPSALSQPLLSSLQHVSDQLAADAIAHVLHNPKSLIEITAKRAASSLQDLSKLRTSDQRTCVSLSAAADRSIGPVLVTTSPDSSITSRNSGMNGNSNNNGNGYEGDRSNGNSMEISSSSAAAAAGQFRKISSSSSRHTEMSEMELLSIEDVLVELRVENEKLREVIDKNNAAMRRQLTIVQNWQKEVKSSKQAYEDLRKDSEEQISQLKQMNEDLRKTIEAGIESQQQQQERKNLIHQENNTTQTGDSLTTAHEIAASASPTITTTSSSATTPTAPSVPARYTPVIAADSSNYWWDMSLELEELKGRLDKINILEETVSDKSEQVTAHQEEVKASKELINKMEREIDQLRAEVINGSADSTMISSLQAQVKIFMQSFADEQKRSQEFSEHVTRLLQELQQVREEKLDLELRLEMTGNGNGSGTNASGALNNAFDSCSIASTASGDLNGSIDEPAQEKSGDRHHKHSHRHGHKHHHREKRDHHKKENKETTRDPNEPAGRYIRKLIKGANVANLASGLKLKSFKDFANA